MYQPLQRLSLDQWHVSIKHQGDGGILQMRQGLHDRVSGTELRILQHPDQIRCVDARTHRLTAMAMNQTKGLWIETARGIDHMLDQRLAGQRVQHFRQVRMHALALSGSENDDVHQLDSGTVRLVSLLLPPKPSLGKQMDDEGSG